MKRGRGDDDTCAPGLLTLPPELRLEAFLDGGGIGGTQDLYSVSTAHRALTHYAGLATRLDKVDGARLTSLLAAFQRDRDHAAGAAAAPAASTPSPPLTRAPTGLKHLAFGKGLDWEADNQALCEAFAEESEREDSGLAGLEVLDLSATCMHSYELHRVLWALAQQGARSHLAVFHPPRMIGFEDGRIDLTRLDVELARLSRLTEIHHVVEGHPSMFFGQAMKFAALRPEASSRLTTLALAGSHSTARGRNTKARQYGVADDVFMRRWCPKLKPGCFANLRVLRLEAPDENSVCDEYLTEAGVLLLSNAWADGIFSRLEEFSVRAYARRIERPLMYALVSGWRRAPASTFANLEVLRLHDFFGNFEEGAMLDFFGERVGDGRWDKLRVLDLTDCCHIGDIGLYRLSAAIEAGFGSALEELDLSVQFNASASPFLFQGLIGPEGVQSLCAALRANARTQLKRLKLNGHPIEDEGLTEIVTAWREGAGALDALEELSVKRCGLTDQSVLKMVKAGFLGHEPVTQHDNLSDIDAPVFPPARLRRLVLGYNYLSGRQSLLPQLLEGVNTAAVSLIRLDLGNNWDIDPDGLRVLLGLLGSGLRELKVGSQGGGGLPCADAMLRVVLEAAAPESPVLQDLRRLDIRRLDVSGTMMTELTVGLREGRFLRKLCQLELACSEVEGRGRAREEAAARMRRELIESRRPLIWDVLTINRRGGL